jgi:hypothetical protein
MSSQEVSTVQELGRILAEARKSKGLTRVGIGRVTAGSEHPLGRSFLRELESGTPASFWRYKAYADFLGIDLAIVVRPKGQGE